MRLKDKVAIVTGARACGVSESAAGPVHAPLSVMSSR